MILEAVRHTGTFPDVYLTDRKTLVITLRTARKDVSGCIIHYFARTTPDNIKQVEMNFVYRDALFDYYQAILRFHQTARYRKYYFELLSDESIYFTAYGFQKKKPVKGYFEFLYANETGIIKLPEWSQGQVFYQIFPERFANGDFANNLDLVQPWGTKPDRDNFMGGDLKGIRQKLDYLEELGIDCIYLNPIFEGDFNHKYATTDYYRIDSGFGNKEEISDLISAIHAKGMRILFDGVFNHCGIKFAPFQDVVKNGEASKYKDWFYITSFPVEITHYDYECVGAYKYMPKMNTGNPEVRRYFIEVMDYWIREYQIDGWRLDVSDEVDESLWEEARLVLKSRYPNILLIGETWGSGLCLMNGTRMDAIMNYVFRDAVRDFVALREIDANEFDSRVQKMLSDYPAEMNRAMYLLLDSHDTERFLTLCGGNKDKFKVAVALQMMFVGSPAVYYGDEIGIDGENDPDCRKCMIWDKDAQDLELKEYYRKLIRIRHEEEAIRTGSLYTDICEGSLYAFTRIKNSADALTIVINAGNLEKRIRLPVRGTRRYCSILTKEIFDSEQMEPKDKNWLGDKVNYQRNLMINIKPYEVIILKEETWNEKVQ